MKAVELAPRPVDSAAVQAYLNAGVPASKINLGVPFYGYCWGSCPGGSAKYMLYKDILNKFPNAWQSDWIASGGASSALAVLNR